MDVTNVGNANSLQTGNAIGHLMNIGYAYC